MNELTAEVDVGVGPSTYVSDFARQTRHQVTFAVPLFENMNEDSTVELHVRLLGGGTDCSRPTKAINIGDDLCHLDAPNL